MKRVDAITPAHRAKYLNKMLQRNMSEARQLFNIQEQFLNLATPILSKLGANTEYQPAQNWDSKLNKSKRSWVPLQQGNNKKVRRWALHIDGNDTGTWIEFSNPRYRDKQINTGELEQIGETKPVFARDFVITNRADTPITKKITREREISTEAVVSKEDQINWDVTAGVEGGWAASDAGGGFITASLELHLGGEHRMGKEDTKGSTEKNIVEFEVEIPPKSCTRITSFLEMSKMRREVEYYGFADFNIELFVKDNGSVGPHGGEVWGGAKKHNVHFFVGGGNGAYKGADSTYKPVNFSLKSDSMRSFIAEVCGVGATQWRPIIEKAKPLLHLAVREDSFKAACEIYDGKFAKICNIQTQIIAQGGSWQYTANPKKLRARTQDTLEG